MKLTKEQLQRFLNNPASLTEEDMNQAEDPAFAVSPEVEEAAQGAMPDMSEEDPEYEMSEGVMDAAEGAMPESVPEFELSEGVKSAAKGAMPEGNMDIMKALRKLKNPNSMEEDMEVEPEVIEDATAPLELRKAAIQKVKKKYLGQ